MLLNQKKARIHTCLVAMAEFNELVYEKLPYPSYSPNFATSNYFLYPNSKIGFKEKRFGANDVIIT